MLTRNIPADYAQGTKLFQLELRSPSYKSAKGFIGESDPFSVPYVW